MRRVAWNTVYEKGVRKCSMDPEFVTTEDFNAYRDAINTALKEAWESYFFPELMRTQLRAYRDEFDAGTTYAAGAEVYYPATEKYYERLTGGSGDLPTDDTKWSELTDLDTYIALEQTGKDSIGEVDQVSEQDPDTEEDCGVIPFRINQKGIQLTGQVPVTVYVRFRRPPPRWEGDDFEDGNYVADAQVYSTSRGDFYKCVAAGAMVDADLDNAAKWERIDVPLIFEDVAATAVYAEWLRTEGQNDKAGREEGKANSRLTREFDKLLGQQGQTQSYAVRSRRSRRIRRR